MRLKLIAALSGVALASVLVASPSASADKPAKPAESGVVQRKDAIGGHPVGPVMTDVGGTMLPILVVVGWDDAVELCTDMRPVINGVEQIVLAPSGNSSVVVHNSDAPVLVFDVSAAKDEEDFIAKCKSGAIEPLATGTVKQRPIINSSGGFTNFKVKSSGVVTDGTGQDWKLQSFIKVREADGVEGPPLVLNEWVKLTVL